MRFAVEEINNSTLILPNVTLGYELLDFCSNVLNLPTVLDFISRNGSIDIDDKEEYLSKIIGIIGPYGSEDTIIIAPLFMMHLIPMVKFYTIYFSSQSNKNRLSHVPSSSRIL